MATVTDLGSVALATAAGYALAQYTNSQNRKIAIFTKDLTGESGTTGRRAAICGVGDDPTVATTARSNALSALNANRRHRYAGAPGSVSGATVATWPDGAATVPVVDTN